MTVIPQNHHGYFRRNFSLFLLLAIWIFHKLFLFHGGGNVAVSMNWVVVIELLDELGLLACLLLRKFRLFSLMKVPIRWFLLLYCWGCLSVFWGKIPLLGCYFALQNIIMLATFCYLMNQLDDFYQVERFFVTTGIIFCLLYFLQVVLGIINAHSVSYSSIAALLLSYILAEYPDRRDAGRSQKMFIWGGWLAGGVLCMGTSSGALMAFAVALLLTFWLARAWKVRMTILLAAMAALLGCFMFGGGWLADVLFPGKTMQSISTGTGRTYLWGLMLELASEHPWLGMGYASTERLVSITTDDAHNSLIGIYCNLGYIGCGIFSVAVLQWLGFLYRRRGLPGYRGVLAAAVCALINSNTSNIFASKVTISTFAALMLIVVSAVYDRRQMAEDRKS